MMTLPGRRVIQREEVHATQHRPDEQGALCLYRPPDVSDGMCMRRASHVQAPTVHCTSCSPSRCKGPGGSGAGEGRNESCR